MSTRITSLPDLPLLEVFANLSLVDLFKSVPLVCQNWHRLQGPALKRRRHLFIGEAKPLYVRSIDAHLLPTSEPMTTYGTEDEMQWCSLSSSSDQDQSGCTTDRVTDTMLSLPGYYDQSTRLSSQDVEHTKRLFCDKVVDQVARAMPHITELTVIDDCEWEKDVRVLFYVNRLLRHYSTTLTVLRLELYYYPYETGHSLDDVVETINTMPQLHTLQMRLNDNVQLKARFSSALLCRLRRLALVTPPRYSGLYDQALDELFASPAAITGLDPQLAIVVAPYDGGSGPKVVLDKVARHVRVLSIKGSRDLPRVCAQFRALTALHVDLWPRETDLDLSLEHECHQVLSHLTALPALTCLSLKHFSLLYTFGEEEDDDDEEEVEQPIELPILAKLTALSLGLGIHHETVWSHKDIVQHLPLGHCFPQLERLCLDVSLGKLKCCRDGHTHYMDCEQAVAQTVGNDCPTLTTVFVDKALYRRDSTCDSLVLVK